MKLLTSYLPPKIRSAFRFAVVGTTGMFVQTWIFMAALLLFDHPDKGAALYYVAFAIGYLLELIPWRDDYISYVVIFIGGCINYLVCLLFFKKKEEPIEEPPV